MLAIGIRFLAGRYHGTPWDHHVNEGVVEWPPSPWRILRALAATSYKLVPAAEPDAVRAAIAPLLGAPSYAIPATTQSHTRHFMPLGKPKDGRPLTTKLFDAFAAVDKPLMVAWNDVTLLPAEASMLDRLLAHMTYLGRSESWVEAWRSESIDEPLNCSPNPEGDLSLGALEEPAAFAAWRARFVDSQASLPKKQRREPPSDWWETLHLDTGRLFAEGWSRPPGVRVVRYSHVPVVAPAKGRRRPVSAPPVAARFELTSRVRPALTEALAIGDRVRQALIKWTDGHPVFIGRDDGRLAEGHGHAYILPSDDDADGRLDHVVIFARAGFDERARAGLSRIRRVWGHGGHDLYLTLLDVGDLWLGGHRQQRALLAPQLGRSRIWESHTPFVAPRHVKRRGGRVIDAPTDQLARLIQLQGLPAPRIEPIAPADLAAPQPAVRSAWHRFRQVRVSGGGARGGPGALGFRLIFPAPVEGPLAFGYGAHQGLGQFVALAAD